eukprot:NODE_1078_length_2618_cov_5.925733.p1 GENE.NODE_1078_length_2618_cov_5.925733~~NODE_1078_length_2618_cov_5.925733.p1  ORF type:complete len:814 (-),score=187.05 NODE_1078_length_2618_cov_5.925733:176-2392(-)
MRIIYSAIQECFASRNELTAKTGGSAACALAGCPLSEEVGAAENRLGATGLVENMSILFALGRDLRSEVATQMTLAEARATAVESCLGSELRRLHGVLDARVRKAEIGLQQVTEAVRTLQADSRLQSYVVASVIDKSKSGSEARLECCESGVSSSTSLAGITIKPACPGSVQLHTRTTEPTDVSAQPPLEDWESSPTGEPPDFDEAERTMDSVTRWSGGSLLSPLQVNSSSTSMEASPPRVATAARSPQAPPSQSQLPRRGPSLLAAVSSTASSPLPSPVPSAVPAAIYSTSALMCEHSESIKHVLPGVSAEPSQEMATQLVPQQQCVSQQQPWVSQQQPMPQQRPPPQEQRVPPQRQQQRQQQQQQQQQQEQQQQQQQQQPSQLQLQPVASVSTREYSLAASSGVRRARRAHRSRSCDRSGADCSPSPLHQQQLLPQPGNPVAATTLTTTTTTTTTPPARPNLSQVPPPLATLQDDGSGARIFQQAASFLLKPLTESIPTPSNPTAFMMSALPQDVLPSADVQYQQQDFQARAAANGLSPRCTREYGAAVTFAPSSLLGTNYGSLEIPVNTGGPGTFSGVRLVPAEEIVPTSLWNRNSPPPPPLDVGEPPFSPLQDQQLQHHHVHHAHHAHYAHHMHQSRQQQDHATRASSASASSSRLPCPTPQVAAAPHALDVSSVAGVAAATADLYNVSMSHPYTFTTMPTAPASPRASMARGRSVGFASSLDTRYCRSHAPRS